MSPLQPPLPAADTTLTLVVPIDGAAVIAVNGNCVLSKEHGVPSLNVHAAWGSSSIGPHFTDDDALLHLSGSYPSLVFLDEGTGISSSLVKPHDKLELHVLGGRPAIDCASQPAYLPNRTSRLEFEVPGQAFIVFSNDAFEERVTLAISANGSHITLHGGALVADGSLLQPLQCGL